MSQPADETSADFSRPTPRPTEDPNSKAGKRASGRNLPAAIISAVVLFVWIIASLLWWEPGFAIFWGSALGVGAFEVARALKKLGWRAQWRTISIGLPAIVAVSYTLGVLREPRAATLTIIAGLVVLVVSCLTIRLWFGMADYLTDVAASFLILCYLGLLGLPLLLVLLAADGGLRVLLLFVCVPAADTGAYAFGSWFGRNKMAPQISPGKTWEGLAGGLVLAAIAGAGYVQLVLHHDWWAGAIIGVLLGFAGVLGDLVESIIKRTTGIKDMGKIIPGHGGAMDRLDSLLMAAPVLWVSQLLLL